MAYDEAFNFYYKENLELLEAMGEVIYFSLIKDEKLPSDVNFLYIGGGYPELYSEKLSKNLSMKSSIKKSLDGGLKCYAECGGLMYLTEKIDGKEMVGFLHGEAKMTNRLQRFGYATIKALGLDINCHEFHHSIVESYEDKVYDIYKEGYDGEKIGWKYGYKKKNVLASYAHIHFFGNMRFLEYLLKG